jgi:hypothetical protein
LKIWIVTKILAKSDLLLGERRGICAVSVSFGILALVLGFVIEFHSPILSQKTKLPRMSGVPSGRKRDAGAIRTPRVLAREPRAVSPGRSGRSTADGPSRPSYCGRVAWEGSFFLIF